MIIDRFLGYVTITASGCWEWLGGKTTGGYGLFAINRKKVYIHRFIYEYYYGQICPDLVIDHLCRNRACCNPIHLEQVTQKENSVRGNTGKHLSDRTHCPQGHEYYHKRNNLGSRICRKCRNVSQTKYLKKLKQEVINNE